MHSDFFFFFLKIISQKEPQKNQQTNKKPGVSDLAVF